MREKSKRYRTIAQRLIRTEAEFEEIKNSPVKIAYLSSDEEKKKNGKLVFGDCTKVDAKYKWSVPYDFFITVYEPNCLGFTDKQFEILLKHELLHIGINNDGNESVYYIVPHDVEEFWSIIDEYGLDWQH